MEKVEGLNHPNRENTKLWGEGKSNPFPRRGGGVRKSHIKEGGLTGWKKNSQGRSFKREG